MNDDKKEFFEMLLNIRDGFIICRRIFDDVSILRCTICPYKIHKDVCCETFSNDFKSFQRIKKLEKLLNEQ